MQSTAHSLSQTFVTRLQDLSNLSSTPVAIFVLSSELVMSHLRCMCSWVSLGESVELLREEERLESFPASIVCSRTGRHAANRRRGWRATRASTKRHHPPGNRRPRRQHPEHPSRSRRERHPRRSRSWRSHPSSQTQLQRRIYQPRRQPHRPSRLRN